MILASIVALACYATVYYFAWLQGRALGVEEGYEKGYATAKRRYERKASRKNSDG